MVRNRIYINREWQFTEKFEEYMKRAPMKNGVEVQIPHTPFVNLLHGPLLIDDFIGEQLVEEEHMPKKTARDVKKILLEVAKHGLSNMDFKTKLLTAKLMLFKGFKMEDGVRLYGKYLGNWGGNVVTYRFEAIKDGRVVKVVRKEPVKDIHIDVDVSNHVLVEENNYDVALVRLTVKDQNDNLLPYYQEPVRLMTEGNISIVGPEIISFKGGMSGTYVRSNGCGTGKLVIESKQLGRKTITFEIK